MALDLRDPTLAAHAPRLSPYLRRCLDEAGAHALRLHAEALASEHLMRVVLLDEDSALHRLVVHAFADPETIAFDVLAISPGMLVVASDATLPFSTRAVEALRAARDAAAAAGAGSVGPPTILARAVRALPEELRASLAEAGYAEGDWAAPGGEPSGAMEPGANLFHHFDPDARRTLAKACRSATRAEEPSIGPARLALAALEIRASLEGASGLTRSRARLVLEGRTVDETPPPERALAADEGLADFLAALPEGAGSLDLLAALHATPGSELTQAFTRQKVSPELLERARGVFADPDSVPSPPRPA